MSVSNLTNTTWLYDQRPETNVPSSATFYINFTSNNYTYSSMSVYYDQFDLGETTIEYDNDIVCETDVSPEWDNQAHRTITITGGTDVTNATLITWLENNATQQQSSSITVDLTTLTNYSSLPSGTYTIKAVAKGTGTYTSSNKSTGVSYTKAASGYTVTFAKYGNTTYASYDSHRQYSLDGTTWNNISLAMDGTSLQNVTSIYFRINGNNNNAGTLAWTNPTGSLYPELDYSSTWRTSGEVVLTGNMTVTFGNTNEPE